MGDETVDGVDDGYAYNFSMAFPRPYTGPDPAWQGWMTVEVKQSDHRLDWHSIVHLGFGFFRYVPLHTDQGVDLTVASPQNPTPVKVVAAYVAGVSLDIHDPTAYHHVTTLCPDVTENVRIALFKAGGVGVSDPFHDVDGSTEALVDDCQNLGFGRVGWGCAHLMLLVNDPSHFKFKSADRVIVITKVRPTHAPLTRGISHTRHVRTGMFFPLEPHNSMTLLFNIPEGKHCLTQAHLSIRGRLRIRHAHFMTSHDVFRYWSSAHETAAAADSESMARSRGRGLTPFARTHALEAPLPMFFEEPGRIMVHVSLVDDNDNDVDGHGDDSDDDDDDDVADTKHRLIPKVSLIYMALDLVFEPFTTSCCT